MDTLVQVVTVALAVVAIIWHQQRTIEKLRNGTSQSIDKLRNGTSQSIDKLRNGTSQSIDKLRDDTTQSIDKLRDDTTQSIDKLRDDTTQSIDKLRDDTDRGLAKLGAAIASNGERLARIEGFLGIGMPDAAASKAAGATLPRQSPGEAEEPGAA